MCLTFLPDLDSTIELIEHLINFRTQTFPSSEFLLRYDLNLLKEWLIAAKVIQSFLRLLQLVWKFDEKVLVDDRGMVQITLRPLQYNASVNAEWHAEVINFASILFKETISQVTVTDLTYKLRRHYYQIAHLFARSANTIVAGDSALLGVTEQVRLSVLDSLKSFLQLIAANSRSLMLEVIRKNGDHDLNDSLEILENDIIFSRVLALVIPSLDSFAAGLFNKSIYEIVNEKNGLYSRRLASIYAATDDEKLELLTQQLSRRSKILHLIESNVCNLDIHRSIVQVKSPEKIKALLTFLLNNFYSLCNPSSGKWVIFISPAFASNSELLKLFFETNVERCDLFSDDFIFLAPQSLLESTNILASFKIYDGSMEDLVFDIPEDPNEILILSRNNFMLQDLTQILAELGLPAKHKTFKLKGDTCFLSDHMDIFTQFAIDSLSLIAMIPIEHTKVEQISEMWQCALTFWDTTSCFSDVFHIVSSNQSHALLKSLLVHAALHLLRLACMNIRKNNLNPFVWAAQILDRFTYRLEEYGVDYMSNITNMKSLSEMYKDFGAKWLMIQSSATKQWERCLVFKKEITELQIAAVKLQRSISIASRLLPDIQPNIPKDGRFLLNFLGDSYKAIEEFAALKKYQIVSILKRKKWIETFCCFDTLNNRFLSVKQIILMREAQELVASMDFISKYNQLSQLSHSHLAQYYYAEMVSGQLYLVMKFYEHRSLHSSLLEDGKVVDENKLKNTCRMILTGLAFLHSRGIAHGDLQPGNVVMDLGGNFKLVDYGDINRQFKVALSKVNLSYMSGTIPFSAPETVLGQNFNPIKADIWSFGCLLIELVTGFHPWHELEHDYAIIYRLGATKFLPEALLDLPISEEGSEFIKSCLIHEPDKRPSAHSLLSSPYLSIESTPRPK